MEQDDPPTDELFAPGLRARALLVGLVVVLAVSTAGSIWAAAHFHQQAARLSGAAGGRAVAPPPFVGSSAPAVVASSGADVPTLSSHSYELAPTGGLRATVFLTAVSTDGGDSSTGQLMVSGLVRGGQAGMTYQFTGGDCEVDSQLDMVWAEGVADATGTAFMSGEDRTLPKSDNYTLALSEPFAGSPAALGPGIEGVFVLGQASRYAGEPCN